MTRQRRWAAGALPAEATQLVGRRPELAEVGRLFGESRLVTLTGVGGVGKSRIALRAAHEVRPQLRDEAWWVELSPLRYGSGLAHAIAEALPLADQSTRPMIDVLAEYLAGRELLLVLDTCEHLVDECALTAEILLRAAPGLRILATSRRPLGIIAERLLPVTPLAVPGAGDERTDCGADAVTLLAARAAEAVPGFAVTDANRPDLERLCRRLDGLPLAIELAAARLRDLSVAELTEQLADRFAVLGTTEEVVHEAAPPWHQALRTAIGWSHELCTPAERLLWARLSVFTGSFDAEAVRHACADDRLPSEQIPGLVQALVDKSLLIWLPSGPGERFRMLDTIQEYGAHWLRLLGEEDVLRRRHRDRFAQLAREGDAAWLGPDQYVWYDRMHAEHDNLRAALEFSLHAPQGHAALELAGSLWFFWYGCGFAKEGRHYLDRALAADTRPSRERTKALWACALASMPLGDAESCTARGTECLAAAEQQADTDALGPARAVLMVAAGLRGDLAETHAAAGRALAVARDDGALTLATLLGLLGSSHAYLYSGRPADALPLLERLRALCDRHGERSVRAFGDYLRAQAELALGRPAAAQGYALEALRAKHRMHDRMGTGLAMDALAAATSAAGQAEHAARLLGLAQRLWETLEGPQMGIPQSVAARQACERTTRDALGDHAYTAAFRTGSDAGIAYALCNTPAPRPSPQAHTDPPETP
ncbi:ATP-binding protein [Streptomyces sp. NPDC102467]|uniref:ATP-binding protein n=1 Tax=Streptomyces sp. NPDC102467 TaxID=3366179 RepID=UPI003826A87D